MRKVLHALLAAAALTAIACNGDGDEKRSPAAEQAAQPASSSAGEKPAGAVAGAGAGGKPAGTGAGAEAGGVTFAQIKRVDGGRLTVGGTTADAQDLMVTLAADAEIRQIALAGAADLQPGQRIVVAGAAGPDGRTEARTVEIVPAGASSRPGASAGAVESITTGDLRLRTDNGTFVFVLTPETQYYRTIAADATDLRPGQWLMIAGDRGTDGMLQARSVTIYPGGADKR